MPYGQQIPDAGRNPQTLMAALQRLLAGGQAAPVMDLPMMQGLNGGPGVFAPPSQEPMREQGAPSGVDFASLLNPLGLPNRPNPGLESILPNLPSMEEIQAARPQAEVDPNQKLLELALGLTGGAGGNSSARDLQAMMGDATAGVAQPFNAQIGLLKHQNAAARADTQSGKKQINKMYRALAKDQKRMGRREAAQSAGISEKLQGLGTAGAQQLGQNTNDILSQNAAAGSGLGSPELTQALNPAVAEQGQRLAANVLGASTGQAANQLATGNNTQRFFNRAAGSSRLEGVNRSADLIANLQDYLAQNRAQIGTIAGEKAQALASAKNELLAGIAQSQSDAKSEKFDNTMDVIKWWTDLQSGNADRDLAASQQGAGSDITSLYPKDMANAMGILGQVPNIKGSVSDLLQLPELNLGITQGGNPQTLDSYATMRSFLAGLGKLPTDPTEADAMIAALLQLKGQSRLPSY